MRHFAFAAALTLASSCATAQTHEHSAASPGAKPVTTPITRTGKTISGQALKLPQGPAEVAAAAVEIPVGGAIAIHKHPWSRFVYVERGTVTIVNHDTGATMDFSAGQLLPEVIDQWHEGRTKGDVPVRLIVIDLVPPGVTNMVMKPSR